MTEPTTITKPAETTLSSTITYQDFAKLDLRVGLVIQASLPDWSEKLIELKVDFGEAIGERIILAGLRQWYQPEDFEDHRFIFVVNLAERKMGPAVSQGMMLAADTPDQPFKLPLADDLPIGAKVC